MGNFESGIKNAELVLLCIDLIYLRQHRTEIVVQMRSQIFRQIVHKFRRHTDVCQESCVQDAGKYEGQMCHKAVRRSLCGVA